jgi:hypothetical protein
VRRGESADLSFNDWNINQPIPDHQDRITGHNLSRPTQRMIPENEPKPLDYPTIQPNDPRFGSQSVVNIPYQSGKDKIVHGQRQLDVNYDINDEGLPDEKVARTRRTKPLKTPGPKSDGLKRKPVNQRWYYEPIQTPALVS